jgi:hypothetical protein
MQGDKDSARMLEEMKLFMSAAELADGQRLVREFVPRKENSSNVNDMLSL